MGNAAKNAPTPNFQFSQGKEENSSDVLESFFPFPSLLLRCKSSQRGFLPSYKAGGKGKGSRRRRRQKKTIVGQDKGIPFAPL